MENHNAEQVKKALEHCKSPKLTKCDGCPRENEDGQCMYRLNEDALALIKELTQANEQLSKSYDHLEKTKDELLSERAMLAWENERLKAERIALGDIVSIARNQARADIVRQLQERLTTFFASDDTLNHIEVDAEYINSRIDKISKEIMEDI